MRETMHATEALGIRPLLFRIRNRVDAVFDGFENWIVALTEHHFFRVLKEVLHCYPQALGDLGNVGLHTSRSTRSVDSFADDLTWTERRRKFFRTVVHAPILALRVPP